VFTLFAACQKDVTIGQETPTTQLVGEDDLASAIGQLNLDPNALDAELEAAMRRMMEMNVTLPAEDLNPVTMPPPMPTGVPIRAEDVIPLMEKARGILNSQTYTLKARGASAPTQGMPIGSAAFTIAVDRGQSAFEAEMDWSNMMRAMAEPGSQEYNLARVNGAIAATALGKKIRIVTKPEGTMLLFLDKKSYFPFGEGEDAGDGLFNMSDMFGEMLKPDAQGAIIASKVTDGGKEYLCAEVKGGEGVRLFYYFLDGNLKRIEMKVDNPQEVGMETMVFEIDLLSPTVDAAMFSTAGYRAISFDELAQASEGGFGSLFGG